ncbi:MAG: hypothetical protein ABW168_01845 [Sedimenticola sp.]
MPCGILYGLVYVVLVAGFEVIQADYLLVQYHDVFQQVRADEACNSGDKPGVLV